MRRRRLRHAARVARLGGRLARLGLLALLGLALAAPSPISVFPAPAGSPWTTVVKQADETVTNSTTMQDDDALTFALAANTTYLFRAVIFFNTPAAADYKYRGGRSG